MAQSFNAENICLLPVEAEAIAELLKEWRASHPAMGVLALLPEAEGNGLPTLQAQCREQGIPLAGAVFPALLSARGFQTDGVWLLRIDPGAPTVLLPDLNGSSAIAAGKIADALLPALNGMPAAEAKPTLFLIFDGLLPNIASILDDLYLRLADRVNYAGCNAGSETFQPVPCLFDDKQIVTGGVLAILLQGSGATVLEHGYLPPEQSMIATSTEGNRILSIDWRPAFEVYREVIKGEYAIDLTPENFYEYAVHFPFGLVRANDDVVVRIPVALTDDGSLFCVGEVPENAMMVLLQAPKAGLCIPHLVAAIKEDNGALDTRGLLTFYCAGRRMHMGDDAAGELAALASQGESALLAGALSLGEIGSAHAWGYPVFHNAALVCTPWPQSL